MTGSAVSSYGKRTANTRECFGVGRVKIMAENEFRPEETETVDQGQARIRPGQVESDKSIHTFGAVASGVHGYEVLQYCCRAQPRLSVQKMRASRTISNIKHHEGIDNQCRLESPHVKMYSPSKQAPWKPVGVPFQTTILVNQLSLDALEERRWEMNDNRSAANYPTVCDVSQDAERMLGDGRQLGVSSASGNIYNPLIMKLDPRSGCERDGQSPVVNPLEEDAA